MHAKRYGSRQDMQMHIPFPTEKCRDSHEKGLYQEGFHDQGLWGHLLNGSNTRIYVFVQSTGIVICPFLLFPKHPISADARRPT